MEHRLAATPPHVHDHPVLLEPRLRSRLGDELEHPRGFVIRELRNVAERVDMARGQDKQVRLGLRVDVANRDEAVGGVDVITVSNESAEEAVRLRQRESPPP